jgi:polyhydroxybutyrate depolymerase
VRRWIALGSLLLFAAISVPAVRAVLPAAETSGGTGAKAAQAPAAGCAEAGRTGRFKLHLRFQGKVRLALVNVAPGASGRERLPVMVALHGAGGWGEFMESLTGLTTEANRARFISVYPSAAGKFWQLTGKGEAGREDVKFIRALLDEVERVSCADHERVYVTGASNGAGLVARVGCELSDRVAAIAPVSGGYYRLPPCSPDRPVSVLEVHGTADESVPYGGKYGEGSVPSFLAAWRRFDRCSGKAAYRHVAAHVLRGEWTACTAGTRVAHLKILGGHHAWQGSPIGGDDDYVHLSTQRQVVAFFRGKHLSGPGA